MSSPYPVLDNRPIDQWKVTELKEELKRRKLTTKGLKDDLVKRLDEAIRNERENAEEDVDSGSDCPPSPGAFNKAAEEVLIVPKTDNECGVIGDDRNEKLDDAAIQVDNDESTAVLVQRKDLEEGITVGTDYLVDRKQDIHAISVETCTLVGEDVVSEIAFSRQEEQNNETQEDSGASKPQLDEDSEPPRDDLMLKSSDSNNQVSEVSPVLGFQVNSDSISTDSVSINEKNELKDNIIADNVKLDLDVIKPEMVEPSSSNVVADGGELHPMDDDESLEIKVAVEETDNNNATKADLNKKNSADVRSSQKLNLERSSGDDSMEEDILESKQIVSKSNSDEVGDKIKQTEVQVIKEEGGDNVVGNDPSADKKEAHVETKNKPVAPPGKRKVQDQAAGNIDSSKRQRRWTSESLKIPEPHYSNITPSPTPKDVFQSHSLKRNFSRSDSTVSEDAPKERVVPPSPKPPTNSLRIDRFLRPFTLKAVQELLGKTGSVTGFWMDHIKTHCYVSYASVDEAKETRNAVYNLQWPPNGGRLLVAEFVDPQEVKMRLEAPQAPAVSVSTAPVSAAPPPPPIMQPQPPPRKQVQRQQLPPPPPPPLPPPPPPPLSNPPQISERLPLPPPPLLPKKHDPPIVTLDDLFQKTKATPRIYYLPLSEEQVAAKIKARGKNTKQ